MDFGQIYHFLFETYQGIGCLIAAFLVITTLVAVILERRTKALYKDRGDAPKKSWLFDDDEEEDQKESK